MLVVPIRTALAASLAAVTLLLAALAGLGLAPPAAILGWGCGVVVCGGVHRLVRADSAVLGPADVVTLTRSMLTCALAALVVDASLPQRAAAVIVPLAVLALALDAVDGRVARATRTESGHGARFDGEADAFLLLVLSVHVASSYGWWVLLIGGARYAFGLAGWVAPWLRVQLPFRYWRKVVTACAGISLVLGTANVLPHALSSFLLVVALALLAESFGRDVLWSWRHRAAPTRSRPAEAPLALS